MVVFRNTFWITATHLKSTWTGVHGTSFDFHILITRNDLIESIPCTRKSQKGIVIKFNNCYVEILCYSNVNSK